MPFHFKVNTEEKKSILNPTKPAVSFYMFKATKLVINFMLKDFYNQDIYLDGLFVLSNLSNPKAQTNSLIRIIIPQCHWQLCRR